LWSVGAKVVVAVISFPVVAARVDLAVVVVVIPRQTTSL
jgi:hypothetical protein